MTKRIFRGIFYVSILTMLASLVFIIGVMYQDYDNSLSEGLKSKAYLISDGIDASGNDYLNLLKNTDERITVISPDGTVLYDNKADISTMENHIDRKEIKEALKNGSGEAVRYSDTLSQKNCYFALALKNGNVLRISESNYSVLVILLKLMQPIAAVALISVLLSFILASLISKKILKPINEINLDKPNIEESYDELSPLVGKINSQNRRIKRQIAELTRSQREFEIISDNMSEGLLLTDKNCEILMHNKSVIKFFDVDNSIDGKNVLTVNRSQSFRNVIELVKTGKHSCEQLKLFGKYYEILGNPVFDEKNMLCGAVILIIDVTEKEKREKLRREFTANVSHELKTPLTSIYGISDMLKSGIVKQEDVKSFSDDINKESLRLISLVNDIIKLSELDENNITQMDDNINLLDTSKEVANRLSDIAKKSNINIEVNGIDTFVTGNPGLLFEMIYNLCENAIKYNKENGSIKINTGIKDGNAFVSVKDTGIGIASEDRERIFERFYRVDKSRSKQSGGTGLGLSIVKHIAICHGATISVKSEVGTGTEITIAF